MRFFNKVKQKIYEVSNFFGNLREKYSGKEISDQRKEYIRGVLDINFGLTKDLEELNDNLNDFNFNDYFYDEEAEYFSVLLKRKIKHAKIAYKTSPYNKEIGNFIGGISELENRVIKRRDLVEKNGKRAGLDTSATFALLKSRA